MLFLFAIRIALNSRCIHFIALHGTPRYATAFSEHHPKLFVPKCTVKIGPRICAFGVRLGECCARALCSTLWTFTLRSS